MYKSHKVMLIPNNKQETKLFQTAGAARYAYNWALSYEQELHESGEKFMPEIDLRKVFTEYKHQEANSWLCNYSNDATKQAIKDAVDAYIGFFNHQTQFPRFKSRRHTAPAFYVDCVKIQFTATHVKLEKIADRQKANRAKANWIRLAEHNRIPIGNNIKYANPRVTFDGLHWWISVSINIPDIKEQGTQNSNDGIGIDVGIKNLAVCSDGNTYDNINKTKTVKRLEKKKRRVQRAFSRKLEHKKSNERAENQSGKNLEKNKVELIKVNQRLTNIRTNHLHQATAETVNRKPKFIAIEDLNVTGMVRNHHLAKAIQDQKLAEFSRQIQYKCANVGIPVILVDRFFPSSKTCSSCGYIKEDLKLSDRTYHCPCCGNVIDRDLQAAINLKHYGELHLSA